MFLIFTHFGLFVVTHAINVIHFSFDFAKNYGVQTTADFNLNLYKRYKIYIKTNDISKTCI